MMALSAFTGLVLAGHACGREASVRSSSGLTEIRSGEVRINRTATRYAIVSMPDGADSLYRIVVSQGWQTAPGQLNVAGPGGSMNVRAFERNGRFLYTVNPGSNEDWAIVAEFASRPIWAGSTGDTPGRDPLGLPRFGGARRIVHFEGRGFEAACYASSVKARAVLAEAANRLSAVGWTIAPFATKGISAIHAGAPPLAVYAEEQGAGTTFLVVAGTLAP